MDKEELKKKILKDHPEYEIEVPALKLDVLDVFLDVFEDVYNAKIKEKQKV